MIFHNLNPHFSYFHRPEPCKTPSLIVLTYFDGGFLSTVEACRNNKSGFHAIIAQNNDIYYCAPFEFRVKCAGSSYGPREHRRFINTKHRLGIFIAQTTVDDYALNICVCKGADPLAFIEHIKTPEITHLTTLREVNPYRFKEYPIREHIYALEKMIPYWSFPKSCYRNSL